MRLWDALEQRDGDAHHQPHDPPKAAIAQEAGAVDDAVLW